MLLMLFIKDDSDVECRICKSQRFLSQNNVYGSNKICENINSTLKLAFLCRSTEETFCLGNKPVYVPCRLQASCEMEQDEGKIKA